MRRDLPAFPALAHVHTHSRSLTHAVTRALAHTLTHMTSNTFSHSRVLSHVFSLTHP